MDKNERALIEINMIIESDVNNIIKSIDFEKLRNKSILITGSSGLLGIYFVSCLKTIQKEYNIDAYFWIKSDIDSNFKSFFDFDCHIIKEDISDLKAFDSLPMFDFIIHSSGYGQPDKFLEDQIKTIQINTTATINLFEKLNPNGTFLFLSSSEVYNGLDKFSVSEDEIGVSNTTNPRACYIESKRCGEAICHIQKNMGKDVKIARLSLTYGPGTKPFDTRVVSSLIQKSILNDSIELRDRGEAIRTYCYISDVIEMMWNIILHGKEVTYNVGGNTTFSIFEMANIISTKTNKPILLPETSKTLTGSPKVVNINIDKYISEFNKTSFIALDEGLNNTILWQQHIYKI